MKKIGFIGAFDKTDLIIYVAKVLAELGKKTLVIDATILQKARYIVPCIAPSKYYITEYEKFDVSVGFEDIDNIKEYLGISELEYDIVLIDIDTQEGFKKFNMSSAYKNYFITAFDNYSLKKGLEIIGKMKSEMYMTKVLFSREMIKEQEEYLNFLSFYFSIKWEKEKIYFPYEQGDNSVIIENQRASTIKFKNLSLEYKEGIFKIVEQILPEEKSNAIRRIIKNN